MIKLLITACATALRPRGEALAHLRQVHGPMVYDPPADARAMPSAYVQNHVAADFAPPAPLAARPAVDIVTEVWFEDIGHLKASTATDYYLRGLKPDEPRFVDQASVRPMIVVEDRRAGAVGDGAWKLFLYLKAAGDAGAFQDAWRDARTAALGHCLADAANRPIDAPGAPPPFVSGVWALWFADREQATGFASETLPAILEGFATRLDPAASFMALAEEYSVDRLRRENG